MDKFGIALQVEAKHGAVYKYMSEHGLTLDQMSAMLGTSKSLLSNILHFRWEPKKNKRSKIIRKLEKFFGCPIEELYPPELVEQIEMRKMLRETHIIQKEINIEYLPFGSVPEIEYTQDFDSFDMRDKIQMLLKTLTPKEQSVLRDRFGLFDKDEQTYEELGKAMGLSREEVRHIELKALRKLQQHERSQVLKELAEYERHT